MKTKDRLNSIQTTPAINLLPNASDRQKFCNMYLDNSFKIPRYTNLVKYFKYSLGKQDFCWTGSHKNWIWEFCDGDYLMRVFVNNTQGISIEFDLETPPENILNRSEKFWKRLFALAPDSELTK